MTFPKVDFSDATQSPSIALYNPPTSEGRSRTAGVWPGESKWWVGLSRSSRSSRSSGVGPWLQPSWPRSHGLDRGGRLTPACVAFELECWLAVFIYFFILFLVKLLGNTLEYVLSLERWDIFVLMIAFWELYACDCHSPSFFFSTCFYQKCNNV